jgi:hypothetical protein
MMVPGNYPEVTRDATVVAVGPHANPHISWAFAESVTCWVRFFYSPDFSCPSQDGLPITFNHEKSGLT